MIRLVDLGFLKDEVVETIVSTYDSQRIPNAAPMGAIMGSQDHIIIRPFLSSSTYRNLKTKRCAVVNITSNAKVYYITGIKESNPSGRIPQEMFGKAKMVDAPKLAKIDALAEVSVLKISPFDDKRAEVLCKVKRIEASKTLPKAYSRALYATIEAIIHATRVKVFLDDDKERQRVLELIEKIRGCHDVVNRVAPNSVYSKILADLTRRIESWREKSEGFC
ncbi:DUF447 family protein [Candidatus Bathyarchaeota archaeon]|nr:DUF447 family protein [Candidatus Bathyarchaeota archaeon]